MDPRYSFWIYLGVGSIHSPYTIYVFAFVSALYVFSRIRSYDGPGLIFGVNNIGIWLALYSNLDYGVFFIGLWAILVSINYLVIKHWSGGSD